MTFPSKAKTYRFARFALSVTAILGGLAAFAAAVPPQQDLQQLRNRGQALFEEKQFATAVDVFAEVAEHDEATAQDYINLALARYESNDDPGALQALAEAELRDAANPAVFYMRGLTLRRQGEPATALPAFERAAELDPTDPPVRYQLGATLESLGRSDAARAEYERVIGSGFDIGLQHYVSSLYRAGFLLLRERQREEAGPYLERYQEHMRRLSQAQRAPAALEVGRYKRVVVPRRNLAAANLDSAARLSFVASSTGLAAPLLVDELRDGTTLLVRPDASGTVLWPDGRSESFAAAAGPAALGDFDRDGLADLYVAAADRGQLFRRLAPTTAAGAPFEAVASDAFPVLVDAAHVLWVDSDHDGDLDLVVSDAGAAPGTRLIVNHGGDEFVEATESAGFDGSPPALQTLWGDFDGDSDVDLFVVRGNGRHALYTNLRGGRFEDIAAAVGASGTGATAGALAEDFDNDGALDLVLGGPDGITLLRNKGDGTFEPGRELASLPVDAAMAAADLNNDGFLDLVANGADGVSLLLNDGRLGFVLGSIHWPTMRLLAATDSDADGTIDLLLQGPEGAWWQRGQAPLGNWLGLSLEGIKNNILGIGATVEIKAGGLYASRPVRSSRLHVGLGGEARADVVRITWPNGIVQNDLDVDASQLLAPIGEVERLEGSCPLLYTWDGERWRFINEVLGVAPLGMPLSADVVHPADYDEYVPVPQEALRSVDGVYELRFTEELREAGYLDAIRLIALDHPVGTRVYPDEKFVAPPHPEFKLFLVQDPRPVRGSDSTGADWTEALAVVDGQWAVPFEPDRYEGLATPHALELQLEPAGRGEAVRLFLTGWVYWATGSINRVVDEDPRVSFTPVALQVPDGAGGWRTAIDDIGLPNAKNSTLVVDLTEHLDRRDPRVRIVTTMRLYWDAAFSTVGGPDPVIPEGDWQQAWRVPRPGPMPLRARAADAPQLRLTTLPPLSAQLRFRGFSELQRTADGFETFDYAQVSSVSNWDQHPGSYTSYGAVGDLLQQADDRFVILGTGDEVAIRFAADLPELPAGWSRDWLVYLNGWVKDGDPNTLHGDRVEPLPFHGMSGYPYGLDEAYPETEANLEYLRRYNQRPARTINLPLGPGTADRR